MRSGAALLLLLLSGLWPGCTAEKRYRTLSFFFDGVPDPSEAAALAAGKRTKSGTVAAVYTHKPFADENCNACHTGGVNPLFADVTTSSVTSSVCMKCHAAVPTQYPIMHGPVAAVECLWCHAPHESNVKALLRLPSPDVCLQCHTRELLPAEPIEHQNPTSSCLDCHMAHGGERHGLLRSGREVAVPATTLPSLPAAPVAPENEPAPGGGRT